MLTKQLLVGLLLVGLGTSTAHAKDPSTDDSAAFLNNMRDYFAGEKAGASGFMAAGLGGYMGAAFLYTVDDGRPFLQGMAIPLVAVGTIHLLIGATVYLRTDAQLAALEKQWKEDPAGLRAAELERMAGVNRQFDLLRWIEIGLLVGGVGLAFGGNAADLPALSGAGLGLGLESLLSLGLDALAEERADRYTSALDGVAVGVAPLQRDTGWIMAVRGEF